MVELRDGVLAAVSENWSALTHVAVGGARHQEVDLVVAGHHELLH